MWVGLIVGIFVGAFIGIVITGVVAGAPPIDPEEELRCLREQRRVKR